MNERFLSTYVTEISASPDQVWKALTDASMVKQYFFGTELKTTWEVGTPIIFSGEYEGQAYVDKGTVLEYKENEFLSYNYLSSWTDLPDSEENYLIISYKVEPIATGTKLTITQTNYDAEKAQHSESSWGSIMDEMKKLL